MTAYGDPIRNDAWSKVTGKARYVADLSFPDMLYMRTVHAELPSAIVRAVDPSAAESVPGVVRVYTAANIPGDCPENEKPVLVKRRVRSLGDAVAVVAAESESAARAGAAAVRVLYEAEHPAVVTAPEEALLAETEPLHGGGNEILRHPVRKGDIEKGFQNAALVLERDYATSCVMPGFIEPEGAVVRMEENILTVYCPCKAPFNIRRIVTAACGLPMTRVRVIQCAVGGSFGGKDDDTAAIASRAALAVLDTGRPCRLIWSREESVREGVKRHAFQIHWKIGADRDGHVLAAQVRGFVDGGAYLSKSKTTCFRSGIEATGPYAVPNVDVLMRAAYTNHCYAGAVRGFGSPQADFASETMMDELAQQLGLTPWEIRERNILHDGDVSGSGQPLEKASLDQCLSTLKKEFGEDLRPFVRNGKLVGRGIACLYRGESYGAGTPVQDVSGASITVNADGSIWVTTGLSEVGQGGHTMLACVIRKLLGVDPSRIQVAPVDTAYCVDSGATAASRGTITGGNAVYRAALQVRDQLADALAEAWDCDASSVRFENDRVTDGGKHDVRFQEAVALYQKTGMDLRGFGWWLSPHTHWDKERGTGSNYISYAFGACGAEVEVDPVSGKVQVTDFMAVHDLGEALHTQAVRGQISGGVSMGVGYALTENVDYAGAAMRTKNLSDYLMPTAMDLCRVRSVILENHGGVTPLRIHGIGEPATSIVAPAVLNALSSALGVRIRSLPADLETVRRALDERRDRRCD